MKIKFSRFWKIILIEIIILIILNLVVNNVRFNTRTTAGSYAIYAPLVFLESIHTNSIIVRSGFYPSIFILNLIIIIGIAFILSIKLNKIKK